MVSIGYPSNVYVCILKELVTEFSAGFFRFSIRMTTWPGLASANCMTLLKVIVLALRSSAQMSTSLLVPESPVQ